MNFQLDGVLAAKVSQADDKPLYHRGNSVLIGISLGSIALFIFAKVYYFAKDDNRAKKWDAMSSKQKQAYIDNITDLENKRLDLRFVHWNRIEEDGAILCGGPVSGRLLS